MPAVKKAAKKAAAKKRVKANPVPKPGSKDFAAYAVNEARVARNRAATSSSVTVTKTEVKPAVRERRSARAPDVPSKAPETALAASYFAAGASGKAGLEFVSTGCSALDEILGGGVPLGRCINIVGDKSVGKTLLAMEITTNFCMQYPDGAARYAEGEAAFDQEYARALGAPIDRILFNDWLDRSDDLPLLRTVEDLYDDLVAFLNAYPGVPKLYIIDSLDSLSDEAELEADFDAASFGGSKPKMIGKLFRQLVGRMETERCAFVVVSQIRDKMNAKPFQEQKTRSGGKALDFYASQQLWLTEFGKITREVGGLKRVVGVDVEANVKKNKVGLAHRRVKYPVLFGYGIDDLKASVDYLIENKCEDRLASVGLSKAGHALRLQKVRDEGGADALELRAALAALVKQEYRRIETSFLPARGKYG